MSLTNNQIKEIKSLSIKKYRDSYGKFVVEGFKGVQEVLESDFDVDMILVRGDISQDERVIAIQKHASKKKVALEFLKSKECDQLSQLETPPGIIAVVKKNSTEIVQGKNIVILDSVKDPGNMGTIVRTADWFGIDTLVVGPGCVDIYNSKVVQGSMGSLFHITIVESDDLSDLIQGLKGYTVIATSLAGGGALDTVKAPYALLVGNESEGISPDLQKLASISYKILGAGKAESLNVGVATGIVLEKLQGK